MTNPTSPWTPDAAGWARLLGAIDARDAAAFAAFIAEDGEFRFGNSPPVVGRGAIRDAVAGFFAAIGGCRHTLKRTWSGPGTAACEGEVTYTRLDGSRVTIPFANVFDLGDGLIRSYRIYIDNGPLFNAPA